MKVQKKQRYFFKEGEEVFHLENPSQKMYVEEILLRIYKRPTAEDPAKKENMNKILGIKCHWWEGKSFHTNKFHKSELVPFSMSEDSYAEIQRWIAENNS